jgi:hypothetical protein
MTDEAITDRVRLPWGPYGERYTDYGDDFTFLSLGYDNAEVVASTPAGWPTIVRGRVDGTAVGVAIGHVSQLTEEPIEEIDVFVDDSHEYWALVEFEDLSAARSGPTSDARGLDGYEILDIDRRSEGFALFETYADRRVTPVFELPDDEAAFAIQRAPAYGTLQTLFGLHTHEGVDDRVRRLEREILPREEWVGRNPLSEIAADLADEDGDE